MDETTILASLDEANALVQMLRERAVTLNVEVRRRDEQIDALQKQLEELKQS